MNVNIKNHLHALFWTLIILVLGIFSFNDFGLEKVKGVTESIGGRPVFIFYLGSIFALLVFVIEDLFRRPNFQLSIGAINERPDGAWRFLHVNVINLDWSKWFFLFRRKTANNTSAEIIFKEKDNGKIIFSMAGRWSTNLEPITWHVDSSGKLQGIYDPVLARSGTLVNISPSLNSSDLREGKLVIAFKSKDENECYGFNNDSYGGNWTHDERPFRIVTQKLDRGIYDIEVIVRSGRTQARKKIILENLGNTLDKMILKEK